MMKHIVNRAAFVLMLLLAGSIVLSFCIFTNSSRYFRKYLDADIPFDYQLHVSTPSEWIPAIDAGAEAWEVLPSCYFEFENGGFTTASDDIQDGINLVFFDLQGVNFPPPTNTIAYSRTYTVGSGASYHSIESDLIWNARDFPPSTTGDPGAQDLQSVISHEVGHHMGLAHTGPIGGPPGCGELLPSATMYGQSANGDTTKRSLHIDDIASASRVYPVWILQGAVTDVSSGLPLPGTEITSPEPFAAVLFDTLISPSQNTYEMPGAVQSIPVQTDGSYSAIILRQEVDVEVQFFGYQLQSEQISFNPPGGIGQTQTLIRNFALQANPIATISGILRDSLSAAPVEATADLYVTGNAPGRPSGIYASTVTSNGSFSFNVPSQESYKIVVTPEAPYPAASVLVDNLPVGGAQVTFELNPANILLVNDDVVPGNEAYLQESLEMIGMEYFTWRIAEKGIPQPGDYALFPQPRTVLWFTGNAVTQVLSDDEQQSLAAFLDSGGRLLLTGQNIAESSSAGILMSNYLQASSNQGYNPPVLRGVDGDPVGAGMLVSASGGAGNQNSKDVLTTGSNPVACFNYGAQGTSGIAGVRVENSQNNWKAVFLGFGLEGVNNLSGIRDLVLRNTLVWFDVITGLDGEGQLVAATLPGSFELHQNFPNPFNPATTIRFSVPQAARVKIAIFNNLGQEVRRLTDIPYPAGVYELTWDGRDDSGNPVASGVYFYLMRAGDKFSEVRKMVILK